MTMKTRSALLVGAGPRWNDDLYPILQQMRFDVVSLESISDVRSALRGEEFQLIVVCGPFEGMSLVSTLDIAKSLAPDAQVVVLGEHMTERDLRDALISGCFAAVDRPLGYKDLSAILSSADDGMLVYVR
jgi:DNA-binding NtrC family response regulator